MKTLLAIAGGLVALILLGWLGLRIKPAPLPASKDSVDKILWINEALQWGTVDGSTTAVVSAAIWFDEGSPWAVFQVEELVYNVDVELDTARLSRTADQSRENQKEASQ